MFCLAGVRKEVVSSQRWGKVRPAITPRALEGAQDGQKHVYDQVDKPTCMHGPQEIEGAASKHVCFVYVRESVRVCELRSVVVCMHTLAQAHTCMHAVAFSHTETRMHRFYTSLCFVVSAA